MNKPYHRYQLQELEQRAGKNLDRLLTYFSLKDKLRKSSRFYVGNCPIHGGDKNNAFNIFHKGDSIIGNWRCFTHNCHKIFQPTIIGFVRGILSHIKYGWRSQSDKDKEYPFREAVEFLCKFCDEDINNIEVDYEAFEMQKFASQMHQIYNREIPEPNIKIPKNSLKLPNVPSDYYVSRGYSKEILLKYNIGLCIDPNKQMYMRSIVPIYDINYENIVGCTGRTIFNKCPLCNSYHNPIQECPKQKERWKYSKWRHNQGFKGEFHLYNYWFSKEYITKTGIAIIVEGPGDVWRLEEAGIHNSIATFGAHLTDSQKIILDKSGALALIILTDPDEAGRLASETIRKQCKNAYNLYFPTMNGEDIGDTSIITIKEKLVPMIEEIQRSLYI